MELNARSQHSGMGVSKWRSDRVAVMVAVSWGYVESNGGQRCLRVLVRWGVAAGPVGWQCSVGLFVKECYMTGARARAGRRAAAQQRAAEQSAAGGWDNLSSGHRGDGQDSHGIGWECLSSGALVLVTILNTSISTTKLGFAHPSHALPFSSHADVVELSLDFSIRRARLGPRDS